MNKRDFLARLREGLSGFPRQEIEDRIAFYEEIIDDKIEDGLSEEEAVSKIGTVSEVVEQIVSETPLVRLVKEKIKPKNKMKAWEITLLAVGSPVWIALILSAVAVAVSLYASVWAVIVSLWAVQVSLSACAVAFQVGGIFLICTGHAPTGIAVIAGAFICAGLAIFAFYGCKSLTKGVLILTKKSILALKTSLVKKEDSNE